MNKRSIWQIESEKERYGDLLENVMKKQEEKETRNFWFNAF